MKLDPYVKSFLDIMLESTGIDPAYITPDMQIHELGLDESLLSDLKAGLESHFHVALTADLAELKKLSCRDLVGVIKSLDHRLLENVG